MFREQAALVAEVFEALVPDLFLAFKLPYSGLVFIELTLPAGQKFFLFQEPGSCAGDEGLHFCSLAHQSCFAIGFQGQLAVHFFKRGSLLSDALFGEFNAQLLVLLADPVISLGLRGLSLQGAHILLYFKKQVSHPFQIGIGIAQLAQGFLFANFELGYACCFFKQVPP